MKKFLRFISVSYKTTTTVHREKYHLSLQEQEQLFDSITQKFSDISGILILATCNRTEIYFESNRTSADVILNTLINFKNRQPTQSEKNIFIANNATNKTLQHLLLVSSGLESMVFGDAEIIAQIKKAHQFSSLHKRQGSLLERALQAVFKTHKRISNETDFRDGTTSVAYKSLKVVKQSFDAVSASTKKILFVGAGDIVKQLFKYNDKFNFTNIYVSNRTQRKADVLVQTFQCQTYPWENIVENNFDDFDVIISAASNCPYLIKTVANSKKIVLIDLAMPSNINKELANFENVVFHDLDSISVELEETKAHRLAATNFVNEIISQELALYQEWLQARPLRAVLGEIKNKILTEVTIHSDQNNPNEIKLITNKIMRTVLEKNLLSFSKEPIGDWVIREIQKINENKSVSFS